MDIKVLQTIIGHSDPAITLKVYDHVDNERMKMEANRVYNIYILKNDKYLSELKEELEGM